MCSLPIPIILLLLNPLIFCVAQQKQKCCPLGQSVIQKNTTLECRTVETERIRIKFQGTDLISSKKKGECFDIFNGNETGIFEINEAGAVSKAEHFHVDLYPKCCPLGYIYDEKHHSCEQSPSPSELESSIPFGTFVYAGLPRCEIIFDVLLSNLSEIELTGGKLKENGRRYDQGTFCLDSTSSDSLVVRTCVGYEVCERIRCFRKCCQDGQSFVNGSKCRDTLRYGVDSRVSRRIEQPDAPFAVVHGMPRPIYILKDDRNFRIDERGIFSIFSNLTETYNHYQLSDHSYCIEHAYKKGKLNDYAIFSRALKPQLQIKFAVTRWIKILSCIFLFITMAVYLTLPKMLNLFGKILLSYSFATFLFFFFLCLSQFLSTEFNDAVCKMMGYLTIMASFWSFTWLNIMCIDIWISFGNPRTLSGPLQRNELKRLIQYSIYGWGVPFLWVIIIAFFNTTSILPASLHPYVGYKKCYMENTADQTGNYAYNVFITMPVLLQQIINVVFFAKTLFYCLKIRGDIQRMNESSKKNYRVGKEELNLVMKLAVIMGISFIFETISSMYDFSKTTVTRNIEVVWDTINCSQGIFIFVVFICKRKIFTSLMERWKLKKPCKYDVTSSLATQDSLHTASTKRETLALHSP